MLTGLVMTNIRRHVDTTLDFGEDSQIVLLDGSNGAGKTTILEAIQWALFGYTRHGAHGLSKMIRRGAEHEGMSVQCSFTVAGTDYSVARRWEKGKSTAVLSAADVATHRGVSAVNAEISNILGVDAAGFLLSSVATQTDRAELSSLSPAKRRQAITRLFRHDAYTTAKLHARKAYNEASAKVSALTAVVNSAGDIDIDTARTAHERAKKAVERAETVLATIATDIAREAEAMKEYNTAALAAARSNATHASSEKAAHDAQALADKAASDIPAEPVTPARDLTSVELKLNDLTRRISDAQASEQTRDYLSREQKALTHATRTAEDANRTLLALGNDVQAELSGAIGAAKATDTLVEKLREEKSTAERGVATANAHIGHAEKNLAATQEVDDTCYACGQHVDPAIAATTTAERREALAAGWRRLHHTRQTLEQVTGELVAAIGAQTDAHSTVEVARANLSEATDATDAAVCARKQIAEHDATITRLRATLSSESLTDLHRMRATLETERARWGAYQAQRQEYEYATRTFHAAAVAANAARTHADSCAAAAAAAVIPEQLVNAASHFDTLTATRDDEQTLASALRERVVVTKMDVARLVEKAADVDQAKTVLDTYRAHAGQASKAAAVLERAATIAAAQTRPQLQADISVLLATMSNDRFTGARLDDDYGLTIEDSDGTWADISEYSGGEIDLIALAVRLALARRVSPTAGGGFLILDEVFGSQDGDRCQAIIDALRTLRTTYGQILLISHVGGLAEGADRIVSVAWDRDENVSTAA